MEKNGDGREKAEPRLLARRLSEEVGISEPAALDLIKLIGTDWNSLLREARLEGKALAARNINGCPALVHSGRFPGCSR